MGGGAQASAVILPFIDHALALHSWSSFQLSKTKRNSFVSILTSRVEPDEKFSHLVIHPNQNGMRHSHKPVLSPGNKRRKVSPRLFKEITQTLVNSGGRGRDFLLIFLASLEIANMLHHTRQALLNPRRDC